MERFLKMAEIASRALPADARGKRTAALEAIGTKGFTQWIDNAAGALRRENIQAKAGSGAKDREINLQEDGLLHTPKAVEI